MTNDDSFSSINRPLTIGFVDHKEFRESSIRGLRGEVGLYFIFLLTTRIPYPFAGSRLIYVGMSESKQNSVGSRLRDHSSGQSGNLALTNYIEARDARFVFHSADFLNVVGTTSVCELEYIFLSDFMRMFGSLPICNNQTGTAPPLSARSSPIQSSTRGGAHLLIDWSFFD